MAKPLDTEQPLREQIGRLETAVFAADRVALPGAMVDLIDALEKTNLPATDMRLPAILRDLLQAYQQQDYLLFADLLTYRLRPLVQAADNIEGPEE